MLNLLSCNVILAEENVTGGHLEFSVNYGIIPVLRIKMELCIALKRFGLTCPISAGMYRNSTHLNIPRSLPGVSHV